MQSGEPAFGSVITASVGKPLWVQGDFVAQFRQWPRLPFFRTDLSHDFCDGYALRAGLATAPDSQTIALAERLVRASAFQFGLVIEIVIAAIEVALLEETTALQARHFVLAYEHRSSCSGAFNPFIITDYRRIDARKVFIREAQ